MYRYSYTIEIEGIYTPERDCQLVGGRFLAKDEHNKLHHIKINQVSETTGKYIGADVKEIGTWVFEYNPDTPMKSLTFVGYFKCHPFWVSETKVAEFRAPSSIYDQNGLLKESEINKNLLSDKLHP